MEYVEPIRDKSEIFAIGPELLKKNYRNYVLFTIGCNTSFRISDLLSLTAAQAREQTHINLKAKKTGKKAVVAIGNIAEIIDQYTAGMLPDEYLFKSRKKPKPQAGEPDKQIPDSTGSLPISRIEAWRALSAAAKSAGIPYPVGTHSMRKTFAYWYYTETKDVATLMRVLGHSSERQTLDYIGINQDVVDEKMAGFVINTGSPLLSSAV